MVPCGGNICGARGFWPQMNAEPTSKEEFYRECAALLGARHDFRPWRQGSPNRWNNRRPGNGRFPGFGMVRYHSPSLVQVALRRPVAFRATFASTADAITALRQLCRGESGRG